MGQRFPRKLLFLVGSGREVAPYQKIALAKGWGLLHWGDRVAFVNRRTLCTF